MKKIKFSFKDLNTNYFFLKCLMLVSAHFLYLADWIWNGVGIEHFTTICTYFFGLILAHLFLFVFYRNKKNEELKFDKFWNSKQKKSTLLFLVFFVFVFLIFSRLNLIWSDPDTFPYSNSFHRTLYNFWAIFWDGILVFNSFIVIASVLFLTLLSDYVFKLIYYTKPKYNAVEKSKAKLKNFAVIYLGVVTSLWIQIAMLLKHIYYKETATLAQIVNPVFLLILLVGFALFVFVYFNVNLNNLKITKDEKSQIFKFSKNLYYWFLLIVLAWFFISWIPYTYYFLVTNYQVIRGFKERNSIDINPSSWNFVHMSYLAFNSMLIIMPSSLLLTCAFSFLSRKHWSYKLK